MSLSPIYSPGPMTFIYPSFWFGVLPFHCHCSLASVTLASFCPWTHFQSMQYSWLNVQLNCQPVKAASVGSSIYNLCPRSRAHAECSQSPPISDRFASPPLIHPTTPSIHHPQHLRHPLHLTNFYRATPSKLPSTQLPRRRWDVGDSSQQQRATTKV